MNPNPMNALQHARNLTAAVIPGPALAIQATGLLALLEAALKGAGQIAYRAPFTKSVENYFTAKFDKDGQVSRDQDAQLSWGGYVVDKLQIPYLFNVVRPFKKVEMLQSFKAGALFSVVSMGMLQGAHLLAGKPHPLYNKVLGCGFSIRVADISPLEQIAALIGKARSTWGI